MLDENKEILIDQIKSGNIQKALILFAEGYEGDDLMTKIGILFQARFSTIKQKNILGILTNEQYQTEINKLNIDIIESINTTSREDTLHLFNKLAKKATPQKTSSGFLVFSGISLAIVLAFLIPSIIESGLHEAFWDMGIMTDVLFLGALIGALFSLLKKEKPRFLIFIIILISTPLLIVGSFFREKKPVVKKENYQHIIDSLAFQDLELKRSSKHFYITGKIVNNSLHHVNNIKVKIKWFNSNGVLVKNYDSYLLKIPFGLDPSTESTFETYNHIWETDFYRFELEIIRLGEVRDHF